MTIDFGVAEKVKQLHREGLRPSERLARTILNMGDGAVGPLIDLATDLDLLHDEAPECYAPIHAIRLLGELRSLDMIEDILTAFPAEQDYADEPLPRLWNEDAIQMIARIGTPAVEPLWEVIDDDTWHMDARGGALQALTYITAIAPETRAEIVTKLRERLEQSEDAAFSANVAAALSFLGVKEIYSQVMALYREKRIDANVLPPATARQYLLGDIGQQRIRCVNHSLWERYDDHGPFPEEEQED